MITVYIRAGNGGYGKRWLEDGDGRRIDASAPTVSAAARGVTTAALRRIVGAALGEEVIVAGRDRLS